MTHIRKEPRYWGEPEGEIITAISILGLKTYDEIRKVVTDIPGDIFDDMLNVLLHDGDIAVNEYDVFSVELDLYNKYKSYFKNYSDIEMLDKQDYFIKESHVEDYTEIKDWLRLHSPNISVEMAHFYLDGYLLNDFLRYAISKAQKEIIIVNPYVELVDITKLLGELMQKEKSILLITREPDNDVKEESHRWLRDKGIRIIYNNTIHAKIILLDEKVSIVSSINFTKYPMSGITWEAGIVSIFPKTVHAIKESIKKYISIHIAKK